jgi:hypothetical protein
MSGRVFAAASLLGLSATAGLSLAPLPAAIAQEAQPAGGLEEIIVTSRYREENL